MSSVVLSRFQIEPLLRARAAGERRAVTSPDLGMSPVEVELTCFGAEFPDGELLGWKEADDVANSKGACFVLSSSGIRKVQAFSAEFSRTYSLLATASAPTVMISGVLMHRVKGITPDQDALRKVAAARPILGRVLDTATGLGYTAIMAANEGAVEVVTVELDPVVQDVARDNPWSRDLFSDLRIRRVHGDVFDVVRDLPDRSFARVIHDPPTFKLAGHLYSAEFYAQLIRVMTPGGRLFHYIGDLESRSGRSVSLGVAHRLEEVGFDRVRRRPDAFGLIASH